MTKERLNKLAAKAGMKPPATATWTRKDLQELADRLEGKVFAIQRSAAGRIATARAEEREADLNSTAERWGFKRASAGPWTTAEIQKLNAHLRDLNAKKRAEIEVHKEQRTKDTARIDFLKDQLAAHKADKGPRILRGNRDANLARRRRARWS